MKKWIIPIGAALAASVVCFAGCRASDMGSGERSTAATRAPETRMTEAPGSDLGEKIDNGLDRASDAVSEAVSGAEELLRDGVTGVSEAVSDVGEALRGGVTDVSEMMSGQDETRR